MSGDHAAARDRQWQEFLPAVLNEDFETGQRSNATSSNGTTVFFEIYKAYGTLPIETVVTAGQVPWMSGFRLIAKDPGTLRA